MATQPIKENLTGDITEAVYKTELNNLVDYVIEDKLATDAHIVDNNAHGATADILPNALVKRDAVGKIAGDITGNAETSNFASKLGAAMTLSVDGDASGSVSFDGSQDRTLNITVKDDSHSHSALTLPPGAIFDSGHSFTQNGYQKFGNGLIIQWMVVSTGSDDDVYFAFPIPFPNTCFVASPGGVSVDDISWNASGVTINRGNSTDGTRPIVIIAIGR